LVKKIPALLLFFSLLTTGQQIVVQPTTVNTNTDQTFQISYTLNNGQVNDIILPNLKEFNIIGGGPSISNSVRTVNGRTTRSSSVTYDLQAKKAGNFKIPVARLRGKGSKGQSAPVIVKVSKGQQAAQNGITDANGKTPPIFIKTVIDTNKVYWGQQFIVSYRLYTSEQVTNYVIQEAPAFPGFWVQDITPKRANPGNINIGGRSYATRDMKRFALFPQKTGELSIDRIEANLQYRKSSGRRGFLSSFQSYKEDFESEPTSVLVVPLPETDLPGTFLGGVGQFTVSGTLDRRNCMVDEALKYTVRINGSGNIKLIDLPKRENTENFDFYEPSVSERLNNSEKSISGTKTFEYVVVPRKAGRLLIPEQDLYYYNLQQERYQVVKLPRQVVVVSPSTQKPVVEETAPEKMLEPIYSSKISKVSEMKKAFQSFGLLGAYALPFFLLGAFSVWHKKREEELGDVVGYKKKHASKEALKRLAGAQQLLSGTEDKPFYDEILKSLQKYFIDKLNMPAGDFSKELIDQTLEAKDIAADDRTAVQKLIQQCEIALYAPSAVSGGKAGVYDSAIEIINSIETQIG